MTQTTTVTSVTIKAKSVTQNDWDFVDVILLYPQLITQEYIKWPWFKKKNPPTHTHLVENMGQYYQCPIANRRVVLRDNISRYSSLYRTSVTVNKMRCDNNAFHMAYAIKTISRQRSNLLRLRLSQWL